MKDSSVSSATVPHPPETPLIGSGSQEEVDNRVNRILEMGTSRGYLTYEELNEKLPDEVVSPDKLDSLLMMIDEMGIRLIDEMDVHEFQSKPRARKSQKSAAIVAVAAAAVVTTTKSSRNLTPAVAIPPGKDESEAIDDDDDEEIDLNLEKELAEASTKRIDDPVRMYLTQMGEIPLLTREQEIALAKKIEITRKIFRSKVLESDYCLQSAVDILQQVDEGDLPFDRTMKISTAEDQADKATIGQRIPLNLASVRIMLERNRADWEALRQTDNKKKQEELMLSIRRRRRRATKLLEELSLRTSKVTPLKRKL
jgi:RNA polymerase primary sigma factor